MIEMLCQPTSLVAAQRLVRQWIGIDVPLIACHAMAQAPARRVRLAGGRGAVAGRTRLHSARPAVDGGQAAGDSGGTDSEEGGVT